MVEKGVLEFEVQDDKAFVVGDKRIKTLKALLEELRVMDEQTFHNFVNGDKNDFANWIEFVIGDKSLADTIRLFKDKDSIVKVIDEKINASVKKSDEQILSFVDTKEQRQETTQDIKIQQADSSKSKSFNPPESKLKAEVSEFSGRSTNNSLKSSVSVVRKSKKPLVYFVIGFLIGLLVGMFVFVIVLKYTKILDSVVNWAMLS